jgi:hypothetical protein
MYYVTKLNIIRADGSDEKMCHCGWDILVGYAAVIIENKL